MAYMCFCGYCNHYFFGVSRRDIEDALIDHQLDDHPDEPLKFLPIPISSSAYAAYIQNRGNPTFWETLRNVKKTAIVEARMEMLRAENPSLV